MHRLFMVWYWHDGEQEPMAFFVKRQHAQNYCDALRQSGRYQSACVEEVTADFYAVV